MQSSQLSQVVLHAPELPLRQLGGVERVEVRARQPWPRQALFVIGSSEALSFGEDLLHEAMFAATAGLSIDLHQETAHSFLAQNLGGQNQCYTLVQAASSCGPQA